MKNFYLCLLTLVCTTFTLNAQVNYSGNGNTGFGGPVGNASINIDDDGTTITVNFTKGAGGFNDTMVMYIANGSSGRSNIDGSVNDTADSNRRAISNNGSGDISFPAGFEATHGIAINTGFGGLWEIPSSGSIGDNGLNFIDSVGNPTLNTDASFLFSFDWSEIGLTNLDNFDFVITYGNPNDGGSNMFSSDEAIGDGVGGGNPGTGSFSYSGSRSYPNTWLGVDTSWSNGTNWSEGLPASTENIYIPNVANQPVAAGAVTINKAVVVPGASIDAQSGFTGDVILNSTSTIFSSLIIDGSYSGIASYRRYVNSNDPVNGNDLISAPLSGQAFNTFFDNNPNILSNPIGPEVLFGGFDNDNDINPYELWIDTATTPLAAGQGYRTGIDATALSNFVTFNGTVNTSLVQVAIDQGTASILNLVGNPYPSYLDAQAFLTENAGVLDGSAQVIYGYNDSTDGTSSDDYTIISLLENTSLNIAPGQAFFVASNSTGGTLEFKTSSPDMRITSDQDDFIVGRNSLATTTNVNISLSNSSEDFITKIYFTPSSGLGLDPGYDASLIGGVAPAFALFSHLVQDNMNVPFATQALGKVDYNDTTVALGVNANMGEQLTFSIAESTLPTSIEVYLDDADANTSTLLNSSDYVITPTTSLAGTGRFYLRFSNSALSTPENNLDNILIHANQTSRSINISGNVEKGTMAKVYDIQGRLVNSTILNENLNTQSIGLNTISSGLYIIELSNNQSSKAEKFILK